MTPEFGNITTNHINHLHSLIKNYSSETILKEYIQNADDAGATELIVTYDKQIYFELLDDPKLKDIAYPSLLLSNNSTFRERDFKSILELHAENKIEDSCSTGRFGLGFRSSYSISDYPSILSFDRVLWFDDLKKTICKDTPSTYAQFKDYNFPDIQKWLNTFKVAGYDGSKPFNKTIFRLPLRIKEKDFSNPLSTEVFSFDKFLRWCDEWKDNAKDLLFLRNLNKLVLQEVTEDGKIVVHLEIKTINENEVDDIRKKINSKFLPSAKDTCNKWLSSDVKLPIHKYYHEFQVNSNFDGKILTKKEKWAVVNGLFKGDNNKLLLLAKEALTYKSNVLPWAGVAIEMDNNEPISKDGSWHTFLPLFKSKHPLVIHGWFELNETRTKIIHTGSGDELEILKKWNEMLFENAVGIAWALLIEFISNEKNIKNIYKFWAKTVNDSNIDSVLEECLLKGFYKKISELSCLYTLFKSQNEWSSPKNTDLYFFKDEDNNQLLESFSSTFPLINPKPNKFIINGFKEYAQIDIQEITPEFIRNNLYYASKEIEFPILFEEIPFEYLSKKNWFLEVLKYCADKGEDYSKIEGLPFKLALSNYVYIVKFDTFFDDNPNLELFLNKKHIFLDLDLVNYLKEEQSELPESWISPTLKNKIKLLNIYVKEEEILKKWIIEIIGLITSSKESEFFDAIEEINKLKIVCQDNKDYAVLKSDIKRFSPFIPREEDRHNNLNFYSQMQMNFVHSDYIDIYKKLLKYEGLITELSSETLINHLLIIDDHSFFYEESAREFILDILLEDITWFDKLRDNEVEALNTFPLIKTVKGNIYSNNTEIKLFLPTDFTLSEEIKELEGEYEIVSVKKETPLYSLYKKMGIKEQHLSNYIENIVLPFLQNSSNNELRRNTFKWLANNWITFEQDLDNEIIQKLKCSKIIPRQADEKLLTEASEIYVPSIELPKVLNSNFFKPIFFSQKNIQNDWENFLISMGAQKTIIPNHVIFTLIKIVKNDNNTCAIELFNYMANNFEVFENMKFQEKTLFENIKELAWLPVEYPNDIIKPKTEYKKLRKANELILFDNIKLCGGYYFTLDKSVKKNMTMLKQLGLILNPPIEAVYESFRELMKLNPSNGQVLNYAKEFYTYIGTNNSSNIDFELEDKTILINKQWVSPKFVYQQKINITGIYCWTELIGDNDIETNIAKGLIFLGVKEKPEFDFLIEQLRLLPLNTDLTNQQLRDAKSLLTAIQKETESIFNQFNELPLLSSKNQLILSSKLFINDLDAYNNAEDKNDEIEFCYEKYIKLADKLHVKSLLDEHKSKIYDYEESCNNNPICDILEKNSFKEAILRLLYNDNKKLRDEEITENMLKIVFPTEIIFVKKLVIKYFIDLTFLYRSEEITYNDEGKLYVLDKDDDEDMIALLSKYISEPKYLMSHHVELTKDSYGYIGRILREKMSREKINELLDRNKVIALPKNFDIDEEYNLYNEIEYKNDNTFSKDSLNLESKDDIVENLDKFDFSLSKKTSDTTKIEPPITPNYSAKSINNGLDVIEPPTKPNYSTGRTSDSSSLDYKKTSSLIRDTKYAHVYKNLPEDEHSKISNSKKENGEKAENYVLENQKKYISSSDNYFEKSPVNTRGYDIVEKNSKGNIIKYIEVKSRQSLWGEGGVSITKSQYDFALVKKDKWWLYVVENLNNEFIKVHRLQNPVLQVNRFTFDNSWKLLSKDLDDEPKKGDKYMVNAKGTEEVMTVLNVKKMGPIFAVELLSSSDDIIKRKFSKKWKKI